jgi:hypothetical protein
MTPGAPRAAPALELLVVALLAAAYLAFCNFRDGAFIWSLSPQEGGIWLDEAVRTLHGERIYRDFFEFVAPGNVFLVAAFLAAFGHGTAAVGTLVVATGTIATVLVHAVGAHLLPLAWRASATALFAIYAYQPYSPLNHKWPTLVLCLAALLAVFQSRSPSRCAAAGAALAAATLCTQDMGAAAAAGLALGLWLLRARASLLPLATFGLAYVVTLAVSLAALAAYAAPASLAYDLVGFASRQYGNAVKFTFDLGEPHGAARTFTVFALSVTGLVGLVRLVRRTWIAPSPAVLLAGCLGAALLLVGSWARPIEPVGLGVRAMPLMLVGLVFLCDALMPRARVAVLVFLAATLAPTAVVQLAHAQALRPLVRGEHRAGALWSPVPMEHVTWLERNATPGETVFLFPYLGGFAFLSDTRNPVAYPMVVDRDFTTAEQMQAAGAQLARACPAVGLWDHARLADPIERSSLRPLYLDVQRHYAGQGRSPDGVERFTRRAGEVRCAGN